MHAYNLIKSIGGDGRYVAAPFGAFNDCMLNKLE